mgnify:CR=1 FL=1
MKNTHIELVQSIYEKLIGGKKNHLPKKLKLKESELIIIIKEAKEIIKKEPIIQKISAPVKICGDIHG